MSIVLYVVSFLSAFLQEWAYYAWATSFVTYIMLRIFCAFATGLVNT